MYNKDLVEDAKDFAKDQLHYHRYLDLSEEEHREQFQRDLTKVLRTFRDWGLEVVMDENPLFVFTGVQVDFLGRPLMNFTRRI